LQPASAMKRTIAVAIPRRVRRRCALGNKNSSISATSSGIICRIDMGGFGVEGGGTISAVVVTVTVDVCGGVIDAGTGVHVESVSEDGSAQVSATAELNPPIGVTVTVYVAGEPSVTLWLVGATASVKSGGILVPLPIRVNVCGLVLSPSASANVAVFAPTTVGLNVTLTVQGVVVEMLGTQEAAGVAMKSAAFVPVSVALVNAIGAFVLFVSVIVCAALVVPICTDPKSSVDPAAGDSTKVGISVSFATNASSGPLSPACSGATGVPKVGKFAEKV
jgi:hypothetical protein